MSKVTEGYAIPSLWSDKSEAWHEVMPGVKRRVLCHASTGMVVHYKIEKGKTFPRHNHPHAQFGVILEGKAVFNFDDGTTWPVKAGDSYFFPPGIFHQFTISQESSVEAIDFFTPERGDFLEETLPPDRN